MYTGIRLCCGDVFNAGSAAIEYFEEKFPDAPAFGAKGGSAFHNKAEWIVDITTNVRPAPAVVPRSLHMTCRPPWSH
jgi:hypothetical protein